MSPIPSRTLTARIAGRLRAAALMALLLTHIPPALAQSPVVGIAAPITLAQPEPPARTAPAAAGVTASKTDAPLADTNRNGRTDPGETLRYTVVVSNSSGADLAGVTFDDTLDPNTSLVAGSLQISPLAFGDSYSTLRDTPLAIGAPGVLANDTGTPAPAITPRSVTTAAGGTATTGVDGSFSYTPPPGYTGIDSFSYIATNSAGSDTGVVTLAVRAVPVAIDDSYTVARDTSRTILAPGVLANDTGFPPPSVTPFSGPTMAGGSVTIAGNGGFSYSAPTGFVGDDTFAYTAINAAGSDTATVTLTVGLAPLAQNDAGYVTARDTPLSVAAGTGLLQNDTLGSPAATVLSFGGGALPGTAASNAAGTTASFGTGGALKLNTDGSFDFTPSAGFTGPFSFGYRIGNLFGTSDAVATISVQQIAAITSSAAVTFTVGVAGNFSVTSTGFPTPTLAIGGAALPAGVTFVDNGDGSGTLNGTPGAGTAGTYNLTFTATNVTGSSAPQSFTLTIQDGPIVISANTATFTAGTLGSFAVTTSGFPLPTLAIGGDALPAGVTFVDNGDGTGTLGGTAGAGSGGVYALTFTATNSAGSSTPQQFTLTVDEAPAITSTDAVTFTVGAPSSFVIAASGFPAPTLARGGAALPSGVTFVNNGDGTATLAGTASSGTGGVYALTFTANSSSGASPTQSFRLTILEAPAISSAAATSFTVGVAGSFTITTSGFPTPTIDLTGALPAGVTFVDNGDGTATLAGTPTASGSFPLTLTADNGVGSPVPQSFTLVVGQAPAISSAASRNFAPGVFDSFTVTTTGFPPPSIAIGGTALPAGVTFVDNGDGTGTLSGTPGAAAAGSYALTFTATNSSGSSAPQSFTLTVGTVPAITSANAATFTVGALGSFSVTTSGLPAPAIARGGVALPTGITFTDNGDGTGTLSGTPAAGTAGSYAITFTATNVVGSSAAQSFTLSVNQVPAISSANSVSFPIGTPSSFSVTTSGFPIPSITRGGVALPTGVTFLDNSNGTGTLSGTPGAGTAGSYAITFTAANGVVPDALQNFTLNVTCPAITVTPAAGALADGLYGTAYSQSFTPSGGTGPFTFDLATGTIPGGLTLSAAGALAGTPTGATGSGNFSFSVRATDAFGCQGSTAYTLLVRPDAQPESFSGGVGNTQFVVGPSAPSTPAVFTNSADGVLANDAGAGALTVAVLANPTNGILTLNPDGTFVYTPNVNFAGPSDSFTYTLTDGNGATNTATVTINLSGRVWYVNNSGANGDGRSHSPFNALNNAQAPSSNGDTIFVHTGSGTTTGGITLKPSQVLWGQGTAFTLNSLTIAAGTKPAVNGTVVLANNVTVSSLDITTSGISAMTGSGVTGVTVQNNVALSSTGAAALSLNTSSGNLAFQSITASGGTNGINLTSVGGTLTSAGGSLSNTSGALFNVSGGNGTIAYAGTVSQSSAARLVDIQTRAGGSVALSGNLTCNTACTGINVASNSAGTIDFSAASKTLTTGANPAVTLANNTGATISFTNGGLAISSTSGAGFSATGGGTVNVTGATNTIASTTGTALNVVNTTIGASGLTFQSISANGATNGIVLNNTGSSGGLTVTGNGNTTVGGNSSGGEIQNTTGAGILLTNTRDVSLTNMNIHNTVGSGIDGTGVTNFTFANGIINRSGVNNSNVVVGAAGTSNIAFNDVASGINNLNGVVSITGSVLTNAFTDGVAILNESGTISNLTISNNTLTGTGDDPSSDGSGINVNINGSASTGAAVTMATVANNTINNFVSGAGIQLQGGNGAQGPAVTLGVPGDGSSDGTGPGTGTNIIIITGNVIGNASITGGIGTNGIAAGVTGTGQGNFSITNNGTAAVPIQHFKGIGIAAFGGNRANVSHFINNNFIDASDNIANSSGMAVGSQLGGADSTQNGTIRAEITNNTINGMEGNGILAGVTNSFNTGFFKIVGNTVGNPTGAGVRPGIRVESGSANGDTIVFLEISGNTSGGVGGHAGIGLRKQGSNTNVNEFLIEGLSPSPANHAQMEVYVSSQNPGSVLGTGNGGGPSRVLSISGENYLSGNVNFRQAQPGAPSNGQATPAPQAGTVSANIGTIPAGKHVTILFDVLIANPPPVGVGQLSNQGSVTGSGFAAVLTDDPRKPGAADPTITFLGARKVYLPLIMLAASPPLPDLVVSSITTSGGNLQVTIRNNGQVPAVEPFWVDAYINPTTVPVRVNQLWHNVGVRGATWGVVGSVLPLEPGETLTLTVGDIYYRSALSTPGGPITAGTQLYAQVDSFNSTTSYGAVLEGHERDGGAYNNIAGPVAAP